MKMAFKCTVTPSPSSSTIPETPSVIMMVCWGPSISPWERGWGRGWCRGMRAKATVLCQMTKACEHNNSYQSLAEPVGLCGSLYSYTGMCRCLFKGCGRFRGGGGLEVAGRGGRIVRKLVMVTTCSAPFHSRSWRVCLCNWHFLKREVMTMNSPLLAIIDSSLYNMGSWLVRTYDRGLQTSLVAFIDSTQTGNQGREKGE